MHLPNFFKSAPTYEHKGPFYDVVSFNNLVVNIDTLRDKNTELKRDIESKGKGKKVAQKLLNKQGAVEYFLKAADKLISQFKPGDELGKLKVLLAFHTLIVDYLTGSKLEALNYQRSSSKRVVGSLLAVGSYTAAYGVAGMIVSSGIGVALLTVFGGTAINKKSRKAVKFEGSCSNTVEKLVALLDSLNQSIDLELESLKKPGTEELDTLDLEACELLVSFFEKIIKVDTETDYKPVIAKLQQQIAALNKSEEEEEQPAASASMN